MTPRASRWRFWGTAYALLILLTGTNLATHAPARDVLPFAVEIALLVPAAGVIAALPASRPGARGRPRRPALPAAARTVFAAGGTSAFLAFAVTGLFLSLVPTYVATLSGSANLLLGGGHGLAFLGGLTAVNQAAPADRRAGVLSGFYMIVYLGVGAPVIGVGLLATVTGLLGAVQSFACAVAVLCLMALFIRTRVRA